jgi:tetratricopeptide (TPR) repeat protein
LFCDLGEYESGAQHIERALELDPEHRAVQCNLALLLSHRGDDAAALALCDRLLSENAALHEVRLHRALTRLRHAQFDAGWDDYEARRQVRSSYARRGLPWPEWQGDDLSERTILLFGEQGLGDEVMFASCFGDVIARAKHTIIECSPRLHALFRRSFPAATVLPGLQTKAAPVWLPDAPQIDVQSPAGSLPRHLRRSWHDFPRHRGYLVADGERVRHWSGLLSLLGAGPKIGVSWRGGLRSTRGALRSLGPGQLESLFAIQGMRFVDLQYGDTLRERTELAARGMALASWPEAIEDLDETAALISSLDLVVTVCTTVAHLAGALGKDVWVLVPSVPEWRYLAQGERMPWYPSARLFRQGPAESWGAVVGRVAAALRERVAGGDGEADDS